MKLCFYIKTNICFNSYFIEICIKSLMLVSLTIANNEYRQNLLVFKAKNRQLISHKNIL